MPVQINSLIITANVHETSGRLHDKSEGHNKGNLKEKYKQQESMKEEIIEECIDKVMELLREQGER